MTDERPTTSDTPEDLAAPVRAEALGKAAAAGAGWTGLSTVAAKAFGFLATIPLGMLLADTDYGIYAAAIGFSAFVMAVRDGGVRELLVQRGPKSYEDLIGPVFWLAILFNVVTAIALVALSPLAARLYADENGHTDPRLVQIMWILAAALVLNTPPLLLRAKLRIDMRFGTFARISMASAVVQHGGSVVCALAGLGPLSFAWPFVLVAIFEWGATWLATREMLWRHPPKVYRWRELLGQTKWLIIGSFTALTLNMGPNLVLGAVVSKGVLGVYFFGYQLVAQVAVLLSHNLQVVLLPTLSRLSEEPARLRSAVLRALRALVVTASPVSLGLAVVFGPLDAFIWGGKWAAATVPVQVLALVFPVRVTYGLATSALKARGLFRHWATFTLVQGGGLMLAAGVAGANGLDAGGIAIVIASYIGVSSLIVLLLVMAKFGVGAGPTLRALLPAWGVAVVVGWACVEADRRWLDGALHPAIRAIVTGGVFMVGYVGVVRLAMPERLRETMSVLPGPARRLAGRVLFLRAQGRA